MGGWTPILLAGAVCAFAVHYWFEWRDPEYRQSYRDMRHWKKSPMRHFRDHVGKELAFVGVIVATIVLIMSRGG
jgi:hypothetical protein